MTPWEEIRKLKSQLDISTAMLHERIIEATGRRVRRNDGTQLVPWVETSADWAMVKNARPDWTEQEIEIFRTFVRSLGFAKVVIYDMTGKCVHSS